MEAGQWLTVEEFIEAAEARTGKRLARSTVGNLCRVGTLRAWSKKVCAGSPRCLRWLIDPLALSVVDLDPGNGRRWTKPEPCPSNAEIRARLREQRGAGGDGSVLDDINRLAERQFQLYLLAGQRKLSDAELVALASVRVKLAELWDRRREELAVAEAGSGMAESAERARHIMSRGAVS